MAEKKSPTGRVKNTGKTKVTANRIKKTDTRPKNLPMAECVICGHKARCLTGHLSKVHKMKGLAYQAKYNAPLFAPDLIGTFASHPWNAAQIIYRESDDETRDEILEAIELLTGKKIDDYM